MFLSLPQEEDCDQDEEGGSYRLQYCYGDANKQTSPIYHLAYEGRSDIVFL